MVYLILTYGMATSVRRLPVIPTVFSFVIYLILWGHLQWGASVRCFDKIYFCVFFVSSWKDIGPKTKSKHCSPQPYNKKGVVQKSYSIDSLLQIFTNDHHKWNILKRWFNKPFFMWGFMLNWDVSMKDAVQFSIYCFQNLNTTGLFERLTPLLKAARRVHHVQQTSFTAYEKHLP